jgi:hypothetical protein
MQPDTTNRVGYSVSVVLPLAHRGSRLTLGLFWLFTAIAGPFGFALDFSYQGTTMALVEAVCGMLFLWWSSAKYVIVVSPTTVSIKTTGLGFGWTKSYSFSDISNLRIGYQRVFTYRRPMLAFDVKGKNKIFGELLGIQLKISDPEYLLKPVYAQFPELRPAPDSNGSY